MAAQALRRPTHRVQQLGHGRPHARVRPQRRALGLQGLQGRAAARRIADAAPLAAERCAEEPAQRRCRLDQLARLQARRAALAHQAAQRLRMAQCRGRQSRGREEAGGGGREGTHVGLLCLGADQPALQQA
jgi:hypothetical protein